MIQTLFLFVTVGCAVGNVLILLAAALQFCRKRGKTTTASQFRIFTVEELRKLPIGTRIAHQTLGSGRIVAFGSGSTCFQFDNVRSFFGSMAAFNKNAYPWDIPMKLL